MLQAFRRRGVWMLDAEPVARLREREALFVPVRWLFVGFGVAAALLDTGASTFGAWAAPAVLAGLNVVAGTAPARLVTPARLQALGVAVTAGDGAVCALSMFTYAANPDTATNLLFVLVVLEAAMRWAYLGGLAAGLVSGAVNVAWMAHREAEYGIEFMGSTALARTGAFLIAGLMLGMVIRQLERASDEVRRGLRRTDTVGRFALEAPRLTVEEAARRLAGILHDDLGYEFAAVVVVADEDPQQFRLVATAGYQRNTTIAYDLFPITDGVVGRCFRTGESQLVADVRADPDYLEVDPRTRSEMTVPLTAREAVFGAIDVGSSSLGAFSPEDLLFLEAIAAQLALAFDNARLAEMERRTIAELEALSTMKDDFIAIANHELRTPVTTIAGFAQSLMKQRHLLTEDEIEDAIERLARQSVHLKGLIEDLLTAPGLRGRRPLERAAVVIPDVIHDVVREVDVRGVPHDFVVDLAADLGPATGDPSAVRRVLTNLVGNAVKYSPGGGAITIAARRCDEEVRVDVVDEGLGVAPEDLPALFTKFGRLTGPDGELRGGMGLGLFIVKELVEDMGGAVGVESTLGAGSRFWFTLPSAPAEGAAGQAVQSAS